MALLMMIAAVTCINWQLVLKWGRRPHKDHSPAHHAALSHSSCGVRLSEHESARHLGRMPELWRTQRGR